MAQTDEDIEGLDLLDVQIEREFPEEQEIPRELPPPPSGSSNSSEKGGNGRLRPPGPGAGAGTPNVQDFLSPQVIDTLVRSSPAVARQEQEIHDLKAQLEGLAGQMNNFASSFKDLVPILQELMAQRGGGGSGGGGQLSTESMQQAMTQAATDSSPKGIGGIAQGVLPFLQTFVDMARLSKDQGASAPNPIENIMQGMTLMEKMAITFVNMQKSMVEVMKTPWEGPSSAPRRKRHPPSRQAPAGHTGHRKLIPHITPAEPEPEAEDDDYEEEEEES